MSEITDLGSPDRELSAGDIRRKTNKLNRINTRLENTPAGTRKRHNLEFKKEKTMDQITTGKSGIRPVKKPFKVSHHYDLQQEKKFNAPINMIGDPEIKKSTVPTPPTQKEQDLFQKTWSKTYKSIKEQKYPGAVGVDLGSIPKTGASRKSALNILGVSRKSSPLNNDGGIKTPSILEENPKDNPTFTPGTPWSQYSDEEVKANASSGKPLPKQFFKGRRVNPNINDAWQTPEQAQATEDLENTNN